MRQSWFVVLTVWAFAASAQSSAVQAAGQWPEFRGPSHDGHACGQQLPTTWSETENILWKTPIHGRGWSSPVVWNDQVWLTTATVDGKQMSAVCVDLPTGKIVHDILLFENDAPREIHALNSYASPTPTIEEGRVYVHFGSYGTACLDTVTGATLWQRRDLPCDHHRGPGSSPILFENLLITHYDGFDVQYVVALDKATGQTVWKVDRNVDYGTDDGDIMKAYCTPIVIDVAGQLQLISPTSKAFLAYDPRTGQELWRVRHAEFSATARPLYGHGLLFLNTGFGKAEQWAVRPDGQGDVTDTHVVWKDTKSVGSKTSAVLVDDLIFQVHDQGVATCVDALSGKPVWSKRLGGNYSASPIVADGLIYFCSQEGKITVVRAGRKFEEIAVNQLGDAAEDTSGFMASPAVAGSTLLLRTQTHLYRIGAATH